MREPEPPNAAEADEASASTGEHDTRDVRVPAPTEDAVASATRGTSISSALAEPEGAGQGAGLVEADGNSPDPRSSSTPSAVSPGHPDVPAAAAAAVGAPEDETAPPTARPHLVWIQFDRDALQRIDEALTTFAREGQRALDTAEEVPASHDERQAPVPSAMLGAPSGAAPSGERGTEVTTDDPLGATPAVAPSHDTSRVTDAAVGSADGVVDLTDEATSAVPEARQADGADTEVEADSSPGLPALATPGARDDDHASAASGAVARRGARPGSSDPSSTMPEPPARGRHPASKPMSALGGELGDDRADLAVFPFFVDERPLSGLLGLFDWRAAGRFTRLVDAEGERAGDVGHALLTLGGRTLPARRVVLLGLGSTTAFGESAAELAAARIGDIVHDLRPGSVLFGATTAPAMRDSLDVFLRRMLSAAEHTPVGWFICVESRALARLRRRLEGEGAP